MKFYKKIGELLDSLKKQPAKLIIALLFYFIFGQFWGSISAIFLGSFVLFALFAWDSRIFIGCGLLFLLACPLYLLGRKELMAEEMSIYAYYCLFLGVMLQIIEYGREKRRGKESWLRNILTRIRCCRKK